MNPTYPHPHLTKTGLDWDKIAKIPVTVKVQAIDEIKLPDEPFLKPDEKAVTPGSKPLPPAESFKNFTQFVSQNQEALNLDTHKTPKLFSEIENVNNSIVAADGSSIENKDWVFITTKNGDTLWLHINKKEGTIGFYDPKACKLEGAGMNAPFFHNYVDEKGQVVIDTFVPIYSS
jgi:hypothetical protein